MCSSGAFGASSLRTRTPQRGRRARSRWGRTPGPSRGDNRIIVIMSHTADPQHGPLRTALAERVVIADGAMGSMLQGSAATLDDFAGHEGCNEILSVTRPDIVRSIHDGYLSAGVDAISTNTFGANLGNLGEYGIADRIYEF